MSDDLNQKIDAILVQTTRIQTALWPDQNQKGILTLHDERLDNLESWRNYLTGAWAVVATFFGFHLTGKH